MGQPGAGKTTTLLDLAKNLLARAEKSVEAGIPVLFNLSSWVEDKQSIEDWLKGELKLKYGVSHKLGHQWLEQQKLLPLLDGLDELAPSRQELCVQRINQWLGSDAGRGALVVCSRIEEYENYGLELALRGAVCLQPLSDGQIEQYLQKVGKPELQVAVANDAESREMLRVPLQMSIAVLVYDEGFGLRWRQQETEAERLALLLDAYVMNRLRCKLSPAQLGKLGYENSKHPSAAQTKQWLIQLAKHLKSESKDEFFIEYIQPSLLTTKSQKFFYTSLPGASMFAFMVPLYMYFLGGIKGSLLSLIMVVLMGLLGMEGKLEDIRLVESFVLSSSLFDRKRELFVSFLLLLHGMILGLYLLKIGGTLIQGLIFGLPFLACGIFVALRGMRQNITTRTYPNEGILRTRTNAFISTSGIIFFFVALNLILIPFLEDHTTLYIPPGKVTWIALFYGPAAITFAVFLIMGGQACIQHLSLRLVLWATGQIPWNYARFLNHCTDRLLLQRVGGRYRFIHKRLQDHFAAMPLES